MLIRLFEPNDAPILATLFHTSVHQAGILDYSPEQCAAWSPSRPDASAYVRRAQDRNVLVAIDDDGTIVGYGDMEADGHIDHLYCRADMIGRGIGSMLYAALEDVAKNKGITYLYIEASEMARRLFERRGFLAEGRNEFLIGGVAIHNYRMSKFIA